MPTTTMEDLPADVLACALRRLDGPSLAAASCATAGLRALAADRETWRALCVAHWPSLQTQQQHRTILGSPQRLFADAFPFPSHDAAGPVDQCLPGELVSAVDVYHKGAPIFSRAVETSTSSSWFLTSPFRVDAVDDCKKNPAPVPVPAASISPAELELSWIVVDPRSGRAVNLSSRRAVAVDRHWYTGETLVRYAVLLGGCKFEATLTCSEEAGCLREVSLTVEDADGAAASGECSLRLLATAMAGTRRGGEKEGEEAKRRYDEFVRCKRGRKESKARREVLVDLCCSAVSAVVVLSFLASVVLR